MLAPGLEDAVEYLADSGKDRLNDWLELARLPFADIWIEWGPPGKREGFLATRHPSIATRWLCFIFFEADLSPMDLITGLDNLGHCDGTSLMTPSPFGFVVDTEAELPKRAPKKLEIPLLVANSYLTVEPASAP